MKPKVYTCIDVNEARSPLVRVVHASEWDYLMDELRYLRGERAAVVEWLHDCANDAIAESIERGDHRGENP